jgi:Fur family ferric uptake transcriptional regulator
VQTDEELRSVGDGEETSSARAVLSGIQSWMGVRAVNERNGAAMSGNIAGTWAEPAVEAAMEVLRSHGSRASTPRRAVLHALLAAQGEHRTAEELAAEIQAHYPDVNESTVYRTLDRFEELGIAYHVHLGHGPAQWHLSEDPRLYLACSRCGEVIGLSPEDYEVIDSHLRNRFGFEADFRHFAVTGLCRRCARYGAG